MALSAADSAERADSALLGLDTVLTLSEALAGGARESGRGPRGGSGARG